MTDNLLHTPFYDTHVAFGGRMVDFGGWSLPIHFGSITEEHLHTRTACSVFDVSHMGRLKLTGGDGERFLDHVCTRNLKGAKVGRSYYTHVCREDGGILDDVIVSRFETYWGVVCNGINRGKIVHWLSKQKRGFDVTIDDETMLTAMLAIQGPKTIGLVEELAGLDLSSLKRYHFTVRGYMGARIALYRSGYTGEDGLEIVAPAVFARMLAPLLFGTKQKPHKIIKPGGLGARDTLRIEAGMPLYGHELSEDVDSLTARQGWCVDLPGGFIGSDALRKFKEQGLSRTLVGLQLEGPRIARQHQPVLAGDRVVGEVTSGTLSPTLGKSIAMAYVSSEHKTEGAALGVDLGKTRTMAKVVKLPFYQRAAPSAPPIE